ncbi:MAG: hypothetical protein ACR2MB_10020 [Acidimicrobiales bacterium]
MPGPNAVDELGFNLGDLAFQPDGFPGRVELKGRVYAPEVITGQAPLVILMHGRHVTCASATAEDAVWPCPAGLPEVPSYLGYAKVGRNLASRGMVVVSIGANGINAADGYVDDGGAAARAELVIEHLRLWRSWNASATGSPFGARFVGHIDLANVGFMGHSRGGEGVVAAAQLNQRIGSPFGIKAVLALAPVDFGRRVLGGVPLSVVLPYCDGDVSDLQGASYYDDGRYASPGDPAPKATTLLYGANHNFFNTVWTSGPGSFDDAEFVGQGGPPGSENDTCSVGGAARLTAPQEEQAGAVLMAGFFRRYLTAEAGLQRFVTGTAPFPASSGPARWAVAFHEPARLDVARFDKPDTYRVNNVGRIADLQGVSSGLICNFANTGFRFGPPSPQGVSTTSCPTSGDQAATNDTGTLDVGWVRQGAVVREPLATAGTNVSAYDGLRLRVAVVGDDRNDTRPIQRFDAVLEDAAGHRATVSTDGRTNALSRLPASQVRHAVLNGVRLPLDAFVGVDLTRVRAVELRFDVTGAGRLAISDLAFTAEGTGSAVGPTASGATGTVMRPDCRRTVAQRWGCALADLAWGRDPYPDEMAYLTAGYASADTRRFIIAVVLSAGATRDLFDKRFVERYTQGDVDGDGLEHALSPAGKAHWEVALAELANNLAYSTGRVDTPGEQVDALYQTLTGRSPDPAGRAYWLARVNDRGPRQLATELRRSTAGRGRIVDDRYHQILGRRPDAGGRIYWISRLNVADGERRFVATLLETESFRVAASR